MHSKKWTDQREEPRVRRILIWQVLRVKGSAGGEKRVLGVLSRAVKMRGWERERTLAASHTHLEVLRRRGCEEGAARYEGGAEAVWRVCKTRSIARLERLQRREIWRARETLQGGKVGVWERGCVRWLSAKFFYRKGREDKTTKREGVDRYTADPLLLIWLLRRLCSCVLRPLVI